MFRLRLENSENILEESELPQSVKDALHNNEGEKKENDELPQSVKDALEQTQVSDEDFDAIKSLD